MRSQFTPEICANIVRTLKSGGRRKTAAALAGISQTTLSQWIRKGIADPEGEYGDFAKQCRHAEALNEDDLHGQLVSSAVDELGHPVPVVITHLLKTRHGWGVSHDTFVDFLVERLSGQHEELLETLLEDIANGALD